MRGIIKYSSSVFLKSNFWPKEIIDLDDGSIGLED